ncbi:MarR family transcriptional regulator [Streptomyces sp. NPDC013082]|uniref:LexA family protein n=1 Tax=Streptomyces TaxID=1883 RepID=UPI0029A6A286|nr:MarR family transcriptional regulator [Streptomyces sp. WI03-5b]MDX2621609.1 helix-turn-helix domain-containing protein [Streptomyces sp. WI03-5b]
MTGDAPLSARQESILQAIKAAIIESGEAPSLRQIAERVGLTSASSVHYQLGRLEERGLVRRTSRRWRSCQLLPCPQPPRAGPWGRHRAPGRGRHPTVASTRPPTAREATASLKAPVDSRQGPRTRRTFTPPPAATTTPASGQKPRLGRQLSGCSTTPSRPGRRVHANRPTWGARLTP